ncbi:sugar phosphorylase [Lentimicrobium sp. L6]|uniref:alpha-amylase family glycosyl hydrolase n=1 Tax=Lentimicrobium sp. L6 TaxID=2735916 RepID=UPI0015528ECF|nr:alpha-amylase family glycosyl hydrolase [Lentimicrobium sp. L6]NPD83971.1 sugar phosphorylase [Lentimicrobium sp. L6]
MDIIKQHIEFLYPEQLNETLSAIAKLVEEYSDLIEKKDFLLSKEDVILIAYADSFIQGDEPNLTSLKKVCSTHLKSMINTIHILPFYPFTSDDGFSVVDYKEVNPEFGTWKEVLELNQEFQLMFDAVINHISKSSDWFQGFLSGDKNYDQFFIEANPKHPDLHRVTRPRTLPLLHPFLKQGQEKYIWTTFSEDQIDLNYENPQVFLRVLEVLLFYISKGAKFIRLDAIAFMWKKLGTTCIHLDETHEIIIAYRKIIEQIAPQVVLITETNVPHPENISYFGDGLNEAHMIYNFSLPPLLAYSLHAREVDTLSNWAQSLKLPSDKTCFFNFTASHDGIGVRPLQGIVSDEQISMLANKAECHGGFVSYKSNPDGSKTPYELNCNYMDLLSSPEESIAYRAKRFMLTQAVMLSFNGVPGVYYHSVFGSENDVEVVKASGINRRINRAKIQVDDLNRELEDKSSLRYRVYSEYKKLLELRQQEDAFHPFSQALFSNEDALFIIERKSESESVYCLFNFSDKAINIESHISNKVNITYWKPVETQLKPYAYLWLKSV